MGITNHYLFKTVTWDYANYNFAFWDYSHFRISPVPTLPGNINFLQDHYSFLLMYFIPAYWLLNWLTGTYTLIIIQYSFVLLAAWYTYKIIQLKSNKHWLGVGVLFYYFLLLGRYTSFSADVNLAIISACFIPGFLYYFEIKKYWIALIIFILSLFSRENIPIWFIFIFIVLAIQHRKEKQAVWYSITGIFISVIYFIMLFNVFIPGIETEERQYTLFNYSALGENPREALLFIFNNPIETVKLFFVNHLNDPAYDRVKTEFYIVYLASGGIILLLRPQYFIWFIPIVAQKVLNDSFIRWGIATYYSIEVVTLLPLSVFLVLASLKSKLIQNILTIILCIAALAVTIHKMDRVNNVVPWTLNPQKVKIYDKQFFEAPFNIRKVNKLLTQIPKEAKVSASDHLVPHLAQRQHIYLFPEVKDAEYVVFSVFDNYYLLNHPENEKARNKYLMNNDSWDIIAEEFPVFLLKKKEVNNKNLNSIKLNLSPDTIFYNFENIDSTNNKILFDDGSVVDSIEKISSKFSHSKTNSLLLVNQHGNIIKFNDIEQISYISASVWYFSNNNEANIEATCGNRFYAGSKSIEETDSIGWKKLELNFWVPKHLNLDNMEINLWNSGTEPAYFDDLQIIKYSRFP